MNLLIRLIKKLKRLFWWILNKKRFQKLGAHSFIDRPLKLDGTQNIIIGQKVFIQYKSWLAAMPLTRYLNPLLKIGDETVIGNFNHIYATHEIIIGEKVLTADKVYISDNIHGYEDTSLPIIQQSIVQKKSVSIGYGSWIGENVCIIGANIGKNCVIGANSVVTKDIPDFCIAVGNPAKVIKKYNQIQKKWERVY